jgi:predicted transglutaminase-like cysteine proteinase
MGSNLVSGVILGLLIGTSLTLAGFITLSNEFHNAPDYEGMIANLTQANEQLRKMISEAKVRFETLNATYTVLREQNNQLMLQLGSGSSDLDKTPGVEFTSKSYNWTYIGQQYIITVEIPKSVYEHYQSLERPATSDYSVYVSYPLDDNYLLGIVEKLQAFSNVGGFTEVQRVMLVVSFVQNIPYTNDFITTGYDEYPRYPLETLIDGGGDCEDTSILAASLLKLMGFDTVLLSYPNHMAVGISITNISGSYYASDGKHYYYVETTGKNWRIGEIPPDYKDLSVTILSLEPKPIITHSWESKSVAYTMTLNVKVKNVGTASAQGYMIKAGFEAGEDLLWNAETTDSFNLEPSIEKAITLTLSVPRNQYTRLVVEVVNREGYYVDISYSSWFQK